MQYIYGKNLCNTFMGKIYAIHLWKPFCAIHLWEKFMQHIYGSSLCNTFMGAINAAIEKQFMQ